MNDSLSIESRKVLFFRECVMNLSNHRHKSPEPKKNLSGNKWFDFISLPSTWQILSPIPWSWMFPVFGIESSHNIKIMKKFWVQPSSAGKFGLLFLLLIIPAATFHCVRSCRLITYCPVVVVAVVTLVRIDFSKRIHPSKHSLNLARLTVLLLRLPPK